MIFKKIKLGQIAKLNTKNISKNHYYKYINYLDTSNLTKNKILNIQRFDIDNAPSRAKRLVDNKDILYSSVRPNQLHYGILDNIKIENLVVSTGFNVIKCENDVNPYFIYYYIIQNEITEKMQGIAENSTTTYPSIRPGDLENIDIMLPEKKEQDKIAHILYKLDKKIETNNQTNNNLQEISKQLYKRWFIDFEFSNEDGNPYKSSGGKMIDSELGKIPEGWNIYKLDELFYHISPGTNYQPKRVETGIPFLNVKNINNGYIDTTDSKYITEEDYKKVHKSWKPEENDLLLSRIGTIGLVTTIRQEDLPLAVHYNFIVLKTNSLPFEFAYFLLQSDDFQSKYRYCVKQSVQEYVTVEDAKNIKVALPKNNVLYDIFIKNYERILNIQRENKNLEQLRDTLLPKLMNGEIDLDNIEI